MHSTCCCQVCVCVWGGGPARQGKHQTTAYTYCISHLPPLPPSRPFLPCCCMSQPGACRSAAVRADYLQETMGSRHLYQHNNTWRGITGRGRNQQGCRHTGTYTPDSPLPAAAGGWCGKVRVYVYVPVTHMCTHTEQAPACQAGHTTG
jgi:hypothetical protein